MGLSSFVVELFNFHPSQLTASLLALDDSHLDRKVEQVIRPNFPGGTWNAASADATDGRRKLSVL